MTDLTQPPETLTWGAELEVFRGPALPELRGHQELWGHPDGPDGIVVYVPHSDGWDAVRIVTSTNSATVIDRQVEGKAARIPTRSPKSQAEHAKLIRGSNALKRNARLVAWEAHYQLGLTVAATSVKFPDAKHELTEGYLAMLTGLSDRTVRRAMAEAVRAGFFRRIDNGKGGRNSRNRATYVATVPAWA